MAVRARNLDEWRGVADPMTQSPVLSGEREETITLIPHAGAKLRVAAFLQYKWLPDVITGFDGIPNFRDHILAVCLTQKL